MAGLEDKVAIVTGGAGGIGRASCLALAGAGARVVVADLDGSVASAVADEAKVVDLIKTTVTAYGRLDIVHNNAALTDREVLAQDTDVTAMDLRVWDRMFAVNLTSQMLMCKHAVPIMLRGGGGSVINMSSGAATSGDVTRLAYGVSKAGVMALTRYVATAHGKAGVRANTIVPGLILTETLTAQIPAELLDFFESNALTPHLGLPTDVANLVVFLASDDSRYVTGQNIAIDGGSSAHGAHFTQKA